MNRPASPWTTGDRARVGVLMLAGAGVSAVAWARASGQADLDSQLEWADLGVLGLVIGAFAQVSWFRRGRRALALRRAALLGGVEGEAVPAAATARPASAVFVASPQLRRYHRPDCALAAGRNWAAASRESHERDGRRPCGVCRPGGAAPATGALRA